MGQATKNCRGESFGCLHGWEVICLGRQDPIHIERLRGENGVMEAFSPRRHNELYLGISHDQKLAALTDIFGSNDGDALSNNTSHTPRARPL